VADLPLDFASGLARRLTRALDVEGKIPRALDDLGRLAGADVLLMDAAGGLRAAQLASLGARLILLGPATAVAALKVQATDLPGPATARAGEPAATGLQHDSVDAVVSCWSGFRDGAAAELAEADRILRPGGRLLVLHDYGRDDVSALRSPELPEYTTWGRRDGWFLRTGFKVRVIHCWWSFDDLDDARDFLAAGFGDVGRTVGARLTRPRLSYNVAIYHRAHEAV
jgi:SAM-dependent methyltransferase